MKTYNDIFNAVLKGKTVVTISSYGNTRTYFLNAKGEVRQRFNECEDSFFRGNDVEIDTLLNIHIF